MKRINIICSHYYPENTAGANRIEAIANTLSTENHVTVYVLSQKGVSLEHESIESSANLRIVYLNQSSYSANNFIIRMVFETYYSFKLILLSKKNSYDVSIVSIPYLGLLFSTRLLLKDPIIDIRDLVWEYIPTKGVLSNFIKKIIVRLAQMSLKKASIIVTTSNFAKSVLADTMGINNATVIPNGISSERFYTLSETLTSISINPFTVSYIGNLGIAQNLLLLAKVAQLLPEVRFKIIGDGNRENEIREYLNTNQCKNIEMLGKLEWGELNEHYYASTVLYAQLSSEFNSAVPSKLYEYISTGLPIIYGGVGAVEGLVQDFENIHLIPPNNEEMLLKSIESIKQISQKISSFNKHKIQRDYLRENISKDYLLLVK